MRKTENEFMQLWNSRASVEIAGTAKKDPDYLFRRGLRPKHRIDLFDRSFYFTNPRQIPELRFMVCFIVPHSVRPKISVRLMYKDLSLAWRVASHFTRIDDEIWVGKGDVQEQDVDGETLIVSQEATTDLPLEMQTAVDELIGWSRKPKGGDDILDLVLRKPRLDRLEPYRDFVTPREKAQSNPKNLINKNRPVAFFQSKNSPESLKVAKGFEPDFKNGILETSQSRSQLYHGEIRRFRILSTNRKIQYYFLAGSKHVWLFPPQALTVELSSFGVRTIDVKADDDLFIPGYEYHHFEETENGRELYSQIPSGYAGELCHVDDMKADASPWLDKIPLIKQFRKEVLNSQ